MKKRKSVRSRIIGICLDILLIGMILYIVGTLYLRAVTDTPHASLFGFTTHVVISDSMEPAIAVNDIIVVKRADAYHIGDVITYIRADGLSITHRIVSVTIDGYIVKGDANEQPDPDVIQHHQIVGKAVLLISGSGGFKRIPDTLSVLHSHAFCSTIKDLNMAHNVMLRSSFCLFGQTFALLLILSRAA